MRASLFAFALSIVVASGDLANAALSVAGTGICPNLEYITLPIEQYVPENPGLSGPRRWQLSVCTPRPCSECPATPPSYVIEINANGDGCDVGFNMDTSSGVWTQAYGGLNTFFSGTASITGDRVANVTLICDPAATTPTHDGDVIAYSSQGGSVWNFDIRVKAASVCDPTPPPPPTLPPAANDIVLTAYPALGCTSSTGTPIVYAPGSCAVGTANSSTLRFCVGPELRIQLFNASSECAGAPSSEESLQMGACYPLPSIGGSVELTSCG
jgi:hypothetical protein